MADELLLNVRIVQERLMCGRTKLYELIASGQLPVVRIGRAVRIPAKALEEWVEKQAQVAQRK